MDSSRCDSDNSMTDKNRIFPDNLLMQVSLWYGETHVTLPDLIILVFLMD